MMELEVVSQVATDLAAGEAGGAEGPRHEIEPLDAADTGEEALDAADTGEEALDAADTGEEALEEAELQDAGEGDRPAT